MIGGIKNKKFRNVHCEFLFSRKIRLKTKIKNKEHK
jgi:hypothetical protein